MTVVLYALIPIAIAVVVVILGFGIYSFAKGGEFSRRHSNKLMQYRILFQFVAIVLILLGIGLTRGWG